MKPLPCIGKGLKLKDIAEKLDVPSCTIRRWKSTYKWDGKRSEKITNVRNGKRGDQDHGYIPSMKKQ